MWWGSKGGGNANGRAHPHVRRRQPGYPRPDNPHSGPLITNAYPFAQPAAHLHLYLIAANRHPNTH